MKIAGLAEQLAAPVDHRFDMGVAQFGGLGHAPLKALILVPHELEIDADLYFAHKSLSDEVGGQLTEIALPLAGRDPARPPRHTHDDTILEPRERSGLWRRVRARNGKSGHCRIARQTPSGNTVRPGWTLPGPQPQSGDLRSGKCKARPGCRR